MIQSRWLSVKETAEYLNLNKKHVYHMVSRRQTSFTKVPGVGVQIDLKELDKLLERSLEIPKDWEAKIKRWK